MRNPNGYGSIIKLAGRRRCPYAVRLSIGYKEYYLVPNKAAVVPYVDKYSMVYRKKTNDYIVEANDHIKSFLDCLGVPYRPYFIRQYKYLDYFAKARDAQIYLANLNSGLNIQEHVSIASEPSFKDVYDQYIEFAMSLNKPPSDASLHAYSTAFNLWQDVHNIRFKAVTTKQLQDCLTAHGTMSKASVTRMITILKKMYKYAIAHQICEKDLTPYLFSEYTDKRTYVHTIYTDEEIDQLWKTNTEAAKVTLILIYTGLRCTEFLKLKTEDIHLDERYLTGGIKTKAGIDRIVPIHKRIDPIIREMHNPKNKYFFPNDEGGVMLYSHFRDNKWKPYQKELGTNHYTHDCRHTCSTKLEAAGIELSHRKLILGHKIKDITDGVYTHVAVKTLIADMDLWI